MCSLILCIFLMLWPQSSEGLLLRVVSSLSRSRVVRKYCFKPGGYMTCGWTGVCHPLFRKVSYKLAIIPTFLTNFDPFLAIFRQFLDYPPMFMENLPKKGPLSGEFWPKNPSMWVAHTHTLNMLCNPPPPPSRVLSNSFANFHAEHNKIKAWHISCFINGHVHQNGWRGTLRPPKGSRVWAPGLKAFKMMGSRAPATPLWGPQPFIKIHCVL